MSERQQPGSHHTTRDSLNQPSTPSEFDDFLTDTASSFDTWIQARKPSLEPAQTPATNNSKAAQLRFEGTLWVESYIACEVRSETGTLVVSATGEVSADIEVGEAIIDGQVHGNIRATNRVELQSHARVFGDIESPAVAILPGAIFEGQCHASSILEKLIQDPSSC
jgi:cytoskeletal protein CcmA (bactofilin family)